MVKPPEIAEFFIGGINHRTAGGKLRSRLINPTSGGPGAGGPGSGGEKPKLGKAAAVITAPGRFELLAWGEKNFNRTLAEFLARTAAASDLKASKLAAHCYRLRGIEALRHLCRLASGLDSPTPGETPLLQAVERVRVGHSALKFLLAYAATVKKRVGRETGLFLRPATISAVAVAIAEEIFADEKRLSVAGGNAAGGNASSLLGYIRHHKNWRFSAKPSKRTDILIIAADDNFTAAALTRLMAKRPLEPLFIIDAAIPSTELPTIDGVFYYDLNDLEQRALRASPPQTVTAAERLVAAAIRGYPRSQTTGILGELRRRTETRAAAIALAAPGLEGVELAQRVAVKLTAEFLAAAGLENRRKLAKKLANE